MDKDVLVIYDTLQYECCGEPFKVGDNICWSATKCDECNYLLIENDKNIKYDYDYQGCVGGFGTLTGKVKGLKSLEPILECTNLGNKLLGYKIKDEYNTSEEIRKRTGSSDMLVILKNVKYELETPLNIARLHNTVFIDDATTDLGFSIAKKYKSERFNVILSSDNKMLLNKINDEISKYGKYTQTELIYDFDKNKDKYLYSNFSKFYNLSLRIHVVENDSKYKKIVKFIKLSKKKEAFSEFYIVRKKKNNTIIEFHNVILHPNVAKKIKKNYRVIDSLDNEEIANALFEFVKELKRIY